MTRQLLELNIGQTLSTLSQMTVMNTILRTVATLSIFNVIAANPWCLPGCADGFPPGQKNIGDAWLAIGNGDRSVSIANLTTTLEVPSKPDDIVGLRTINPALDNSVSIGQEEVPEE